MAKGQQSSVVHVVTKEVLLFPPPVSMHEPLIGREITRTHNISPGDLAFSHLELLRVKSTLEVKADVAIQMPRI